MVGGVLVVNNLPGVLSVRVFIFLLIIFTFGCATGDSTVSTTSSRVPLKGQPVSALTVDALRNTEYISELPARGKAQLTDGIYKEKVAPDSASELVIRMSDKIAFGDLNVDGVEDAAVVLISDPGGSGTFYHLAAVVNQDGNPRHIATELLGDRIKIRSSSIKSAEIIIEMVKHGPDEPRCCPSLVVKQAYKLRGNMLVKLSEESMDKVKVVSEENSQPYQVENSEPLSYENFNKRISESAAKGQLWVYDPIRITLEFMGRGESRYVKIGVKMRVGSWPIQLL
jgi:hypothetical protein